MKTEINPCWVTGLNLTQAILIVVVVFFTAGTPRSRIDPQVSAHPWKCLHVRTVKKNYDNFNHFSRADLKVETVGASETSTGRRFQRRTAEGKNECRWVSVREWGCKNLSRRPLKALDAGIRAPAGGNQSTWPCNALYSIVALLSWRRAPSRGILSRERRKPLLYKEKV